MSKYSILGYHGTIDKNITSIRKNKYIILQDSNNWLGDGTYFFYDKIVQYFSFGERKVFDGLKAARIFAQREARRNRTGWVVFKASIESNNVIDLVYNDDEKKRFLEIIEETMKKYKESGVNKPIEKVIGGLFDNLSKEENVEVIIADIIPHIRPRYYIILENQSEVCVKEPSCIIKNEMIEKLEKRGNKHVFWQKSIG